MLTPRKSTTSTTETPTRWTPQKLLQNDTWISLVEAQQLAHGEVEWWKCPNVNGDQIDFLQTPNPVWSNGSKMYVGGWQKHPKKAYFQWHGPGVYYRQDGRVLVGKWVDGKLKGLTKRLWCPNTPCWQENRKADSVIKNSDKQGVPFIYIGKYKGHCKEDHHAVVILKDGTTRRGPWKKNAPVGDWWRDHEKGYTSPEEISRIIGFSQIEFTASETEPVVAAASTIDDDESQAPTLMMNNTTKLPDIDNEQPEEPESHVFVPDYYKMVNSNNLPPRKIYLEPDTSEPGEVMPGTELAHTVGDDEEEIIFVAGDSMDESHVPETTQYDHDLPTTKRLPKDVSMIDPLVSPITVYDEQRSAPHDLPQKLLFGHDVEDISQEDVEWDGEPGDITMGTTGCDVDDKPAQAQSDELMGEEVPSEYKEMTAVERSGKIEKDLSNLAVPAKSAQMEFASSYSMHQLSALVNWLMVDVIGSNPSQGEMEQYARHLLDLGLHSSLMITSTCTTADAANFSWMKPFHRRCFVLWAHKNCENYYQRQLVSITTWLQFEVIGNDADIMEMGYYARKLVSVGFHSVKMILAVCTYDDVDAFDWMKPVHKRLFIVRAGIAQC
ncbi:hypothetical protein FisN_18Hh201 [Fistulifera solaris]|uniref:DEP domain-containing protein n=1 Tax=Fistulifera solaris TaxID=1519565 RepID=A0A1Z5JW00_FISSO|nr:hypothetical protein FisN_18Hh201 [Fistulifera solaris]|eukprot:GAX17988.1 hypothetical protein FisN_18Hh201 [Fistulifera solaris]